MVLGWFTPLHQKGPSKASHLIFSYDLLIFGKGKLKTLSALEKIITKSNVSAGLSMGHLLEVAYLISLLGVSRRS